MRLTDASKETVKIYRDSLRLWILVTSDPPLAEVDVTLLARFKNCLAEMRGLKRGTAMSPNTIRKHLRNIQVLLDKAGPPGPKNRDALGFIAGPVPWTKPPRSDNDDPRFIPLEIIGNVYQAAICMDEPRIEGIRPPDWWRALLVTAYCTQLRRRSLFELLWDEVDFSKGLMVLSPKRMKARRRHIVHMNKAVVAHLKKILNPSKPRELVFPWPYTEGWFHRCFHRLQNEAGVPEKDHFGLHDLRRTAATILREGGPSAAQLALGHTAMSTTQNHYVNAGSSGIVGRALDSMPLPPAFAARKDMPLALSDAG